jgi:hypothetical protein
MSRMKKEEGDARMAEHAGVNGVATAGQSKPASATSTVQREQPVCAICGRPAACFGVYEGHGPIQFACDDCCGHGNEDGWCRAVNHAPEFCGCEGHAEWCPFNLQAAHVTPLPYRLTDFYRVEVSDQHGQVVAIEPRMLAGRDIGPRERVAIQAAIDHLCAFSGLSPSAREAPSPVSSPTSSEGKP